MDYMYVVNENGGGLQIVSLYDPESPRPISAYQGFNTAHNVTVEFENHMLYVAGSNLGNGGVLMLRLSNPASAGALSGPGISGTPTTPACAGTGCTCPRSAWRRSTSWTSQSGGRWR